MDSTNKEMKITGAGELGGPRPGAEGIKWVLSASSSDNRGGEQVGDQACSYTYATGSKDGAREASAMELPISEASSREEFPLSRRTNSKRRKRTISSTTPSSSDVTISDNETDGRRTSTRPRAPPLTRASKRLPTEEERLAELRHAPSASLAVNILEVADSLEQMASTANNFKGTYVRRLRDDADKARANATELAKRTTMVGAQIALEQENLQLRAKLQQVNEEIAELRRKRHQPDKDEIGDRNRSAVATEKQTQPRKEIYPKPPKQTTRQPDLAWQQGRINTQAQQKKESTAAR